MILPSPPTPPPLPLIPASPLMNLYVADGLVTVNSTYSPAAPGAPGVPPFALPPPPEQLFTSAFWPEEDFPPKPAPPKGEDAPAPVGLLPTAPVACAPLPRIRAICVPTDVAPPLPPEAPS